MCKCQLFIIERKLVDKMATDSAVQGVENSICLTSLCVQDLHFIKVRLIYNQCLSGGRTWIIKCLFSSICWYRHLS